MPRKKLRSDAIEDDLLPEEIEDMRLAKELDKNRDKLVLGPEVKVTIRKPIRHVFSLKIGAGELDEIADAAEAEGVSLGLYIREAALARARKQTQPTVDELKARVRELSEAVDRL